jgi:hypothetical protein
MSFTDGTARIRTGERGSNRWLMLRFPISKSPRPRTLPPKDIVSERISPVMYGGEGQGEGAARPPRGAPPHPNPLPHNIATESSQLVAFARDDCGGEGTNFSPIQQNSQLQSCYLRFVLIRALVGCMFMAAHVAHAQTTADKHAIETGRKALQGSADYPWYDVDNDSIQRVDVYPPKDLEARKSKWLSQPSTWTWPDWLTQLLEVLGWLIVVLAIFAVVYFLARAVVWEQWRSGVSGSSDEPTLQGDIDRIEALPFQLQRAKTDLLAEARRCYEAGQYGEAMIYLYSYQLVELDRHQFIRLTKGKTNRQYLREIRSRRGLFDILFPSMIAFEDVFFGRHSIERDRFEKCWHGLDDFHQFLTQATA